MSRPAQRRWKIPRRFLEGPAYETPEGTRPDVAAREKVSLRMQVYEAFAPHGVVLDLYAGKGTLSWLYAQGCERLFAVEKDPEIFGALKANLRGLKNVELCRGSNLRFIQEFDWSAHAARLSYVDFDAYGNPNRAVVEFFRRLSRPRRAFVLSLTDGALLNLRRFGGTDLRRLYLQDFYPRGGGVSPGFPENRELNRELAEYFAAIQRGFVDILAMRHGAAAYPLYFKVNAEASAAYSAYLITPKIVGEADFKRYVGLRRVKHGGASTAKRSLRAFKAFD